jgi:two-component system, NarL family, response regulator NreC
MVNIVLVDDHQIVRKGIKAILDTQSDFTVVGEGGDGLIAVELVVKLHPDILLVDLMMGGINGLEVIRQLRKKAPHTRIIVLSMYSDESYVLEALRSGAKAYVLKDNTAEELVHAIREVALGRRYLSAPLSERAIEAYTQNIETAAVDDPYNRLTTREREILQLAAQGWGNVEIANRLFISPRTVETHRANLMHKLGIRSQTDLIKYAATKNIIPDRE